MIKNNKTCILCSKVYTFCNRCEEFDHLPRWMTIYCSENCRKIFLTLTDYNAGKLSKEQAYEVLKNCDLSDKDKFNKITKRLTDEVMSVPNHLYMNPPVEEVSDSVTTESTEEYKNFEDMISNNDSVEVPEDLIKTKNVKKPKRMKYAGK